MPANKRINPLLKFGLELGPLVLFFLANSKPALFSWLVAPALPAGLPAEKVAILTSTAVLMASVVVALVASWVLTKHWPIMPLVTAVAVLFFGGLTFAFQDKTFIQLKPTIVNLLFGSALLIGLALDKLLLPIALDSVLHLDEEGWKKLTLRWGVFFFVLAGLNEAVRLTQSWDVWTGFKSFGIMPLTLVFALAQTPLIMKHEVKAEEEKEHF
ncbi:intracellular septation protein [Rhodoblastus acidophilus]|uniref:septation protein A n=1 Tax=Rhodoblastus acidophilus TaxID=1074 RepID=UPI002224B528|nr:septation protein A [Rhodoblastus acidophilus]MCW2283684.1 intracellular septation protein [Rhodoblastus acidophilus]MCW2332967.1 intracellular septation protein [Rhodoblastus acidophilus]